ncbi:MAG: VTT domain-containing protein [Candidatus Bathyarchaeia archaeon]|jgi:membrane protein YqaA with SNARE-associated domain
MIPLLEMLIVFATAFGFGLIPFAGPSTLFIASNAAVILGATDVTTLVLVAFLVAMGSALAKSVHYLTTFVISKRLSKERQQRLNADAKIVNRWAFLFLFAAATTPIPDDPIVIPLGLTKYSPYKFFSAYFMGKLVITTAGAFLGSWTGQQFAEWLSPEVTIAVSIALTIIITVVLLKVDLGKLTEKISRRLKV